MRRLIDRKSRIILNYAYTYFVGRSLYFVLFLLVIVLYVRRFTVYDYPLWYLQTLLEQ